MSWLPEYIPRPDYYRRLFSYSKKILDDYLRAISKLAWQTVCKNFETSNYSLKETYLHILTVYNGWLNYNVYGMSSEIPHETEHNPDCYHSIRDMREFKNRVWKGVEKLLASLDEEYSQRRVEAPWLPGSNNLADVLMQVSFEQAHHVGEIIAIFWKLDIEPPEMTWLETTRKLKSNLRLNQVEDQGR